MSSVKGGFVRVLLGLALIGLQGQSRYCGEGETEALIARGRELTVTLVGENPFLVLVTEKDGAVPVFADLLLEVTGRDARGRTVIMEAVRRENFYVIAVDGVRAYGVRVITVRAEYRGRTERFEFDVGSRSAP